MNQTKSVLNSNVSSAIPVLRAVTVSVGFGSLRRTVALALSLSLSLSFAGSLLSLLLLSLSLLLQVSLVGERGWAGQGCGAQCEAKAAFLT